jgi:hypothetical protein
LSVAGDKIRRFATVVHGVRALEYLVEAVAPGATSSRHRENSSAYRSSRVSDRHLESQSIRETRGNEPAR